VTPLIALTNLSNALPADPAKDGPIGVDSADLRVLLEPARFPQRWIQAAADPGEEIRSALSHHLNAGADPCQDRGVDWPCDVAAALLPTEDGGS